ncbi:MAG: non-canonical purine NTP pyrophosphatase [Candidatus Latescibacterota bacterium]|nr:MAG: non-canonical purine NTP pyrophosphatase [Candidatus Latescibacterota bacterium]
MEIVFATRNLDKVREIESIMGGLDVSFVALDRFPNAPTVVEDGKTLEENALKKARTIRDFTGMCALADDTGLEVDALDGAPGVFASRYAGEDVGYDDNNRKLLRELTGVGDEMRTARFRTVMALALTPEVASMVETRWKSDGIGNGAVVSPGERRLDAFVTEGVLDGRITREKRGESGFGYDPVFELPRIGKTLAEIGLAAKNKISHRYRALVELRELLLRWELVRLADSAQR